MSQLRQQLDRDTKRERKPNDSTLPSWATTKSEKPIKPKKKKKTKK